MINDKSIRSLTVFKNSSEVFPNTDIKGGVLYLLYDKSYHEKANIKVYNSMNECSEYISFLNSEHSGTFIPYKELISIYSKVMEQSDLKNKSIQNITSALKPYGLRTDFFKKPSKYELPEIFDHKKSDDNLKILGLEGKKRVCKYVPKDYPVNSGVDTIYKWKLFTSKAMGSGKFGEKVTKFPIGEPGMIATETFIRLGEFDTKYEAEALRKYHYTKFFRALLGILKTIQDASARVYKYVPLQDFTKESDIDWNESIKNIDRQLYRKYKLAENEIDFIEKKVEEMEDL